MTGGKAMSINRCGLTYEGKVVIVTGGSKGIGAGCARVFVDAGAKVVICARGLEEGQKLADELNKKGPGSCVFIACDVSREGDIRNVIDQTSKLYSRLDCLINNAGYHPPHKVIDDFSIADLHDVLNVNFINYFIFCKYTLPLLRITKGNIINLTSLVAQIGQEAATIYCASKGAITSFTKSLAIEESRHGVRVNCISPGNIISDSRIQGVKNSENPESLDTWLNSHQVFGRGGTSEETGQLCLFLASDAASYITGIDIIISGGAEIGYGVKYPLYFIK